VIAAYSLHSEENPEKKLKAGMLGSQLALDACVAFLFFEKEVLFRIETMV